MAKLYAIPEETLVGIANAIRTKTGSDEQMTVPAFASAIEGIPSGGGDTIQGSFTPDSDITFYEVPTTVLSVADLPRVKFVKVYAEDPTSLTDGTHQVLQFVDFRNSTVWGTNVHYGKGCAWYGNSTAKNISGPAEYYTKLEYPKKYFSTTECLTFGAFSGCYFKSGIKYNYEISF